MSLNPNEACTVILFRRACGEFYLAVREFDTKFVKNFGEEESGPSEQAHRASIRQGILSMKLRMEPANKQEIQFLKSQGALGKRAPSCSLLTRDDMIRLLESFGKRAIAERLRVALAVPPDMKSYAGFLYIPALSPNQLPSDTDPIPSRRRRIFNIKSGRPEQAGWESEIMTPPPTEPLDKQSPSLPGMFMHADMPELSQQIGLKRSNYDLEAKHGSNNKVRKLSYTTESSIMESAPPTCSCPDCYLLPPASSITYSSYPQSTYTPGTAGNPSFFYSYQSSYPQPPMTSAAAQSNSTFNMYPLPPAATNEDPVGLPTPDPIKVFVDPYSIYENDCTLLGASKGMIQDCMGGPLLNHILSPHSNNQKVHTTSSPLPPLFKFESQHDASHHLGPPNPFNDHYSMFNVSCGMQSEYTPTDHQTVNPGTPINTLEQCDLTEWYFGQ